MSDKGDSERSLFSKIGWALLGLLGLLYIINPGAGVIELLPDNIPFVGNLDEATAAYLLLASLKAVFGLDLIPKGSKKGQKIKKMG